MKTTTREIKLRDLPSLLVDFTVVWDGMTVEKARAGWGPQAKKYTFYTLAGDGIGEHRGQGTETITVELTGKDAQK